LAAMSPEAEAVKPMMPTLMQALGDSEWTMRLAALNALAALQPQPSDASAVFVRFLNDSNGMVSEAAMNHLVEQTNPVTLPVLDKQLNEKDSYVVIVAASHLAKFGAAATGSVPRLKQLLNDPLSTVRQAATNALAAITGQPPFNSAPVENANITYNFPAVPLAQFLDEYEGLAGKKVIMKATPDSSQTLRVITVRPLTTNEAMTLCEEALKEQAGLIIVHGEDGSLTAVAKAKAE